ncbi:MAG TPA: DUF58 domain-containing protein, partial [Cellvibrionaceae bacterium]
EEVRLYQPGDDIRAIDWRVTARTQVTHTKLYSEERERPVYVVCDQSASLFFGSINTMKSVLATYIAALLGWATISGGDRLGGFVFNDDDFHDIRPRRSKHAVLQLLQALEQYNHRLQSPVARETKLTLTTVLKDLRRITKPGAAVFIISDFYNLDEDSEKQLFELSRHLDITLIAISDPLEQHLAGKGVLTISNGTEQCQLAVGERHFQQTFAAINETRQSTLKRTAERLRLELISISTGDNPLDSLRLRYSKSTRKGGRSR